MWPLFTEKWGAWRQERLGLDPLPLMGGRLRTGLGAGRGGAGGEANCEGESGACDLKQLLPRAVSLLYGEMNAEAGGVFGGCGHACMLHSPVCWEHCTP